MSADPTLTSLQKILAGGDHDLLSGVPVFDVHDEFDEKGNLIRRFARADLERIATATNAREKATGDLALVGFGHTIDGAPESSQPIPQGYANNFRVGAFGPQQKTALLADLLIHKARKAEALTYPRRSIELWVKDGLVDWIALLRRTPERDLGLLAYSRDYGIAVLPPEAPLFYDPSHKEKLAARLSDSGKLRYSMEAHVADSATPPAQGDDDFFQKFAACMRRYEEEKLKYAAGPGFPGGGNVAIPTHAAPAHAAPTPAPSNHAPPPMDEEKVRLQREAELIRFSRLEQQVREMNERAVRAECETDVRQLMYEGVLLDPAVEIDEFFRLDKPRREQRKEYLRKFNRRDPAGGPWVQVDRTPVSRETSVDERNAAVSYATNHNVSYDEALVKTRTP